MKYTEDEKKPLTRRQRASSKSDISSRINVKIEYVETNGNDTQSFLPQDKEQAEDRYGHPKFGDRPKKILNVFKSVKSKQNRICFLIEWYPRQNLYQPLNSVVDN